MKKMIIVSFCCILLLFLGCTATEKYQRICFDADSLGDEIKNFINENTIVVDNSKEKYKGKLPIYKISKRDISRQEYEKMLEVLDIPDNPVHFELEGNKLLYSLASVADPHRGYFEMTEDEAQTLAWDIINKIPFLDGEWECIGIRDTYTISDASGTHISRAGVVFCRLLDGVRVIGEDKCVLYFDGSGLVSISIVLFDYTKAGRMDLIPTADAMNKIKEPDDFFIDKSNMKEAISVKTLDIHRVQLVFVNQYSEGCVILQPVCNFMGRAILADGTETEFQSRIIVIPESYTYEKK